MSVDAAREWRMLLGGFAVVALVGIGGVITWGVHDLVTDEPTRLELAVRCLTGELGLPVVVPAGDPLADSAGDGSLKTTIEGNEVTVALASSDEQAIKIAGYYRSLGNPAAGRLERRGRTVFLWKFESSPTQRQHAYDCQY